MKAAIIEQANRFQVTDFPEPIPASDEVLIDVAACGLCGTDIHILKGEYPATYPLIPGHEFSGTIRSVGSEVTHLQPGRRVCVDPNISCGQCLFCREGQVHLCENLNPIGVRRNGGFAQQCSVPQTQVYTIPDSIDFAAAAMIEPLSCALHGVEQAQLKAGQTVVVLGGGTMGGLLVQLARLSGASQIIVSEPQASRRRLLEQLGADITFDPLEQNIGLSIKKIHPHGVDVVFESAGLRVTAQQTFPLTRRGGTIIFFGVVPPHESITVSPYEIYFNEWTIRGSFVNPHTLRRAVKILADRRIDISPFISHRFSLAHFAQALEQFRSPDSFKIQIDFSL